MKRINRSVFYLCGFLFFFHSSVTIISSFLPVYYQEHGLSGTQIGWLLAIGPFTSLISQPFWGYMSDKYKTIKVMMLICLSFVLLASAALFQMKSFLPLLLMSGIFFSFMAPVGALGDSLIQSTSKLTGTSFGKIRMWGSVGFAMTSLIGGQFLAATGINNIYTLYLIYAIISFFGLWLISDVEKTASKPVSIKGISRVIFRPQFNLFLLFMMFITITHRTNDSFIGIYIKEHGGSEALIGWAWFVGVATEALVFLFSVYLLRFFSEMTYLLISGVLYGIRWFLLAGVESSIEIILLQGLHGITFAIFYLCAFQYVTKIIPGEFQATGQLIFITVFFGLSGIIGSLGGGAIFEKFSGQTMYQLLGFSSLIGVFCLAAYHIAFKEKKIREIKVKHTG